MATLIVTFLGLAEESLLPAATCICLAGRHTPRHRQTLGLLTTTDAIRARDSSATSLHGCRAHNRESPPWCYIHLYEHIYGSFGSMGMEFGLPCVPVLESFHVFVLGSIRSQLSSTTVEL